MIDSDLYEKMPVDKNNFPIRILKIKGHNQTPPHWHENMELLYFDNPKLSGTVRCGADEFEISRKLLVAVNPCEVHSITLEKPAEYWCIILFTDQLSDISVTNTFFEHSVSDDKDIDFYFNEIFKEKYSDLPCSDMIIKGDVYKLAAHLYRNYSRLAMTESEYENRMAKLKRINEIVQYVNEHYDEKLSSSFFAKRYFLSEYYFCHFFKKETGYSFTEYINRLRIEKASVLLRNSTLSVGEITEKIGFNDTNYFCRVFKKYMEKTPLEERNGE